MTIELRQLSTSTFSDFEAATTLDKSKPCYCSWWHIKPQTEEAYDDEKRKGTNKFRDCMEAKMNTGFHMGVMAYENGEPIAWVAVGPLPEFYWAWKRVAALGASAEKTAAIMCFNTVPKHRGKQKTVPVLEALVDYGRQQGWTGIEAYPFDDVAIAKQGAAILWPGRPEEFLDAGYNRIDTHWLSQPGYERSVYLKNI